MNFKIYHCHNNNNKTGTLGQESKTEKKKGNKKGDDNSDIIAYISNIST